jgi:hypothetical protein
MRAKELLSEDGSFLAQGRVHDKIEEASHLKTISHLGKPPVKPILLVCQL